MRPSDRMRRSVGEYETMEMSMRLVLEFLAASSCRWRAVLLPGIPRDLRATGHCDIGVGKT